MSTEVGNPEPFTPTTASTTPASTATQPQQPSHHNQHPSTASTAATTPTSTANFQRSSSGIGTSKASKSCTTTISRLSSTCSNSYRKDYEATPAGDSFVPSLATVLTHLVSLSPAERGQVTRFHAVKAPDISIRDYLERIQKYFGCSNECFVLSLVYIDRIVKIHEEFTVSILNIHRLLITSVMLAAKFFDDVYYSNAFYARVGGVRTKEINLLEWQFLSLVNYHLYVTPREYDQYLKNVLAAVNAGIQRPLASPVPSSGSSTHSPASSHYHPYQTGHNSNTQAIATETSSRSHHSSHDSSHDHSNHHRNQHPSSPSQVYEAPYHPPVDNSHENIQDDTSRQLQQKRVEQHHSYLTTDVPHSSPTTPTDHSSFDYTQQQTIERHQHDVTTPAITPQQFNQRAVATAASDLVVCVRGNSRTNANPFPTNHGQPAAQSAISSITLQSSTSSSLTVRNRQSSDLGANSSMITTINTCSPEDDSYHHQYSQPQLYDEGYNGSTPASIIDKQQACAHINEPQSNSVNSIGMRAPTTTAQRRDDHPHHQSNLYHPGVNSGRVYDHHHTQHYSNHESTNAGLSQHHHHQLHNHFHAHEGVVINNQ